MGQIRFQSTVFIYKLEKTKHVDIVSVSILVVNGPCGVQGDKETALFLYCSVALVTLLSMAKKM